MTYENHILKLQKKYSKTNFQKGEVLVKTRPEINKEYYNNQQRRVVDTVLNNVKQRDSIKEEVHNIVKEFPLKDLCKNCKEEVIISVIILYCCKVRDSRFMVERSKLWNKYSLTWQKYSLILGRLLQKHRENAPIKSNVMKESLIL